MTTPQAPIGSLFGAASTAAEVVAGIDLSGRTAIVTGGASGLGVETTRALRAAGARVIVPARDPRKAAAALAGIDGVELATLDLLDPASIEAFAAGFLATDAPLHLLVNSAGIMACPLARDRRGYESQFATNHLGHFQLTTRLLPALRRAQGARVVSVSSRGHRFSPVVFDDLQFERRAYDRWAAYGQSKTANILFALALDDRFAGDGIRAFAVHPGTIVDTNLGQHVSQDDLRAAGAIDERGAPIIDPSRGMKTVAQGAATSVWCATSPQLANLGGVYCENCEISSVVTAGSTDRKIGHVTVPTGVFSYAVDRAAAAQLWQVSEQLLAA